MHRVGVPKNNVRSGRIALTIIGVCAGEHPCMGVAFALGDMHFDEAAPTR